MFRDTAKSRKYRIFVVLQVFVTLLFLACLAGVTDSAGQCFVIFDQWSEFTKWNVGIYMTLNVGEHVAKNIQPKNATT